MKATHGDWSKVMDEAFLNARRNEVERAEACVLVAREIRDMMKAIACNDVARVDGFREVASAPKDSP